MDPYVFWAVVFFLGVATIVVAIIYFLTRRIISSIPVPTYVFVAFGCFICFMPFPLLSIDVYAALTARDANALPSPASSWIYAWWLTMFFAINILGWIILPVLQSFDESGEFTPKDKFKWAVKENLRLYIILGVVALVLLAYLLFLKGIHDVHGVIALCIAAANAFGLIVLVIFLGAELFGMPRRIWRLSDPSALLQEEYLNVRMYHDDLDSALLDLAALRAEMIKMDASIQERERAHFVKMLEELDLIKHNHPQAASIAVRDVKAKAYASLASVNVELRRLKKLIRRLDSQLQSTIDRCVELDRVIGKGSWFWAIGRKPLFRIMALGCFLLSIFVVTSEIVIPFYQYTTVTISIMQVLVLNSSTRFVSSIVVLSYVASCTLWSTAMFKVFDTYVLVPGVTDAASLCFFGVFLTRLIMPLCYNFLLMANIDDPSYGVTYSQLFGEMKVVDLLGDSFNRFLPVMIPVMAVLIELGIIHRALAWAGFESFEISEESKLQRQAYIDEGRGIVANKKGVELRAMVGATGGASESASAVVASIALSIGNVVAPQDPEKERKEKEKRYAEWKAKQRAKDAGGADAA